jgi:hypothetical protein
MARILHNRITGFMLSARIPCRSGNDMFGNFVFVSLFILRCTLMPEIRAPICNTECHVCWCKIFIHSSINDSTALCWALLQFRNHFCTVGRTPWTGDQPVARPLPTHRTTHTQTSMLLSGIRSHDPSVRTSEDSSCLRPLGHCDQLWRRT